MFMIMVFIMFLYFNCENVSVCQGVEIHRTLSDVTWQQGVQMRSVISVLINEYEWMNECVAGDVGA